MTFNLQPSFCTIYTLYLTCFIFQESRSKSPLLTGEFDPKKFLDKVPDTDDTGIPYPDWKKHLLARQLAEKALKDAEEEKKVFHKEENIRGWDSIIDRFHPVTYLFLPVESKDLDFQHHISWSFLCSMSGGEG